MAIQAIPFRHSSPQQALKREHDALAQVGSWDKFSNNVFHGVLEGDELLPSSRISGQSLHDITLLHQLVNKPPHNAPSTTKSYEKTTSLSIERTKESNMKCLTADSLSGCQNGPSQLDVWKGEFQRHEYIACRIGQPE
ncbi:hypothetical protein L207DRAFT_584942 [Hyaloscypha variabilis F]|uniref:Uncharacterized protein n=1 Tax=Hyaloscypha variabilis (strain UAMH 11265 / GT02V1 / F) TaxID=1149755 RepID=A0A2J6RHN8_HYAVF|nr:hypothetical protein L207DRAFT_584942 [Hyaloscypha variabilis F]